MVSSMLLSVVTRAPLALAAAPGQRPGARLVQDIPEDEDVVRVGCVDCTSYIATNTIEENRAACERRLLREADDLGADLVVVEYRATGVVFCDSCSLMYGSAYRLAP